MNLDDSPSEARFRQEFRGWLQGDTAQALLQEAAHEPGDVERRFDLRSRWHRALYNGGWMGLTWPKEHGGYGYPLSYQLILNEEMVTVEAPPIAAWVAVELVAPVLMRWGTVEQQAKLLPRILSGDLIACQGFSEQEAGSDLAAVRTRASRLEEGWQLDGTKMWTSWARQAQIGLVLARTDPTAKRHHGLSCFLVDMTAPGVIVEPLRMLHGGAEENWLLLREAKIPKDAIVGSEGDGWRIVMDSLNLARGVSSLSRTSALEVSLSRLVKRLRDRSLSSLRAEGLVQRVAALHTRVQALRWLTYRLVGEIDQEGVPGPIASTEKLLWAQLSADVARLALEIGGFQTLTEPPDWDRHTNGAERFEYLRSLANAIEGGTDEIQREIIASRVLGLEG